MDCPGPGTLQAHVDGSLSPVERVAVERHLVHCTACLDRVQAYRRVARFLARPRGKAAGALETKALLQEARRRAGLGELEPPRRVRRPVLAMALAGICLLVLLFSPFFFPEADQPQMDQARAALPAPESALQRLTRKLLAMEPDLQHPVSEERLREALLESCRQEGVLTRWSPWARDRVLRLLRRGLQDETLPLERWLRLARIMGILNSSPDLKVVAGYLRRAPLPPNLRPYAFLALASFHGQKAARALLRLSQKRPLEPIALAQALAATRFRGVAQEVWQLLKQAAAGPEAVGRTLQLLPGREASRLLLELCLTAPRVKDLEPLLLGRPEARRFLAEALERAKPRASVRILRLLAQAGVPWAVPLLGRRLREKELFPAVLTALSTLARGGHEGALLALVRALPEKADALFPGWQTTWPPFRRALGGLGKPALAWMTRLVLDPQTGSVLRHQLLLALALSASPEAAPLLGGALARRGDRPFAISALALLGGPQALAILKQQARIGQGRSRKAALSGLLKLGASGGGAALLACLARPANRRFLFAHLPLPAEPWMVDLLLAGLSYGESRATALALLRGLAGAGAPRGDSPRQWQRYFRVQELPASPWTS